MSALSLASRKQRRSSALAVTTETQHLLECIQCTVQVNDDIAHLHDLLTQLGSIKDSPALRRDINSVIRHCLEVARNAKERFLYIVLNCRDNMKLQNQAGQQLGIFGFCLTYMQGELHKGLNLITSFPLTNDNALTPESVQNDLIEIDGILHTVEKHVHYIRPSSEADTPEMLRRKSDRALQSRTNGSLRLANQHPAGSQSHAICTGLLCMPKKYI